MCNCLKCSHINWSKREEFIFKPAEIISPCANTTTSTSHKPQIGKFKKAARLSSINQMGYIYMCIYIYTYIRLLVTKLIGLMLVNKGKRKSHTVHTLWDRNDWSVHAVLKSFILPCGELNPVWLGLCFIHCTVIFISCNQTCNLSHTQKFK